MSITTIRTLIHGFGLQVLHEIPRNVSKEEFEEWVRKTREHVYAQRDSQVLNDPDDSSNYVSDKEPEIDYYIEWIYGIDLDNLVFHVDNHPLFRLDNMPPDDIFVESISFDHFGHRALYEHTPSQFRYDWRAPPPIPTPESLLAYHSCHIRSSTSSVHDLLDVPVAPSSIERVRTTFMELLVTRRMTEYGVGRYARVLENVPTEIISRKVCSSWQCSLSNLQLDHRFIRWIVGIAGHIKPSAISYGFAKMCVCVSPLIWMTRTISGLLLAIWSIISIQHRAKWAPFMALRALSSTVPLLEWTKMTWVHQSLIRQHFNSSLPSTRERCLRRV
ncbi:hypothetical protein BGY98DRAFT_69519 [Russula aff. rugulosa BPL654]|nr:hypothetical protein BGY98DRAFT_69519 [Russula aff. rugulosa BPL654]